MISTEVPLHLNGKALLTLANASSEHFALMRIDNLNHPFLGQGEFF